jgi:uncharacterized protein YqfA (UPF0365 family)
VLVATSKLSPSQQAILVAACAFFLVFVVILVKFGFIWMKGLMSGAHVPLPSLVMMRLRGISPRMVMEAYIRLMHARVAATTDDIQRHVLAKGDAGRVADWLAAAKGAGTDPEWAKAAALDLAHELRPFGDVPAQDREGVFRRIAKATAPAG